MSPKESTQRLETTFRLYFISQPTFKFATFVPDPRQNFEFHRLVLLCLGTVSPFSW